MNIFISIENEQTAEIKAVKTPKGTINVMINASTIEDASELLKEADSIEVISQEQSDPDPEHTDNTEHYYIAPITMEKAQSTLDRIATYKGNTQSKRLLRAIEKGGKMAIDHNRCLGCLDAHDLVLRTYAGDSYQTIIDSFNVGYYKGYTGCKRDIRKGD